MVGVEIPDEALKLAEEMVYELTKYVEMAKIELFVGKYTVSVQRQQGIGPYTSIYEYKGSVEDMVGL